MGHMTSWKQKFSWYQTQDKSFVYHSKETKMSNFTFKYALWLKYTQTLWSYKNKNVDIAKKIFIKKSCIVVI